MLSLEGLAQRALLIQRIRDFFRHRKYIEVDTPIRLPVLIPEAEIIPLPLKAGFCKPLLSSV